MYKTHKTHKSLVFLLLILVLGLLGACTTTPTEPPGSSGSLEQESKIAHTQAASPPQNSSEFEPKTPEQEIDNSVTPFDKETLYQLLAAEVAGYRGHHDTAVTKYAQVALASRDPGVAARATVLATYLDREDLALKTALVWAEVEPESVDAHRYAAGLLLKVGDLESAIKQMEAVKSLGGLANFELFAYGASELEKEEKLSLLGAISRMLDKYPDDDQLKFSKAVLLAQTGNPQEALTLSNDLLLAGNNLNVVILKVNALKQLGRDKEALTFLKEKVADFPDKKRLRLIYARLLFEADNLNAAKEQYLWALNKAPDDGDILFALALICMEEKKNEDAADYLNRLIRLNVRTGEAHYYLGTLAEKRKDMVTALREYRQAGQGYEYVPAHSRIALILTAQGRIQTARDHLATMRAEVPAYFDQLVLVESQILSDRGMVKALFEFLDQVLADNPDHIDFLYFRAMSGEKFGKMDLLEQDLRRVIELQPDNADALNALGYTLADTTDRHEEALELISKALEIKPDEAAFIDSMGWVQYRLNNFDEALIHLKKALDLFPNDEVAAHLGEVLWVVGEKRQAKAVWKKGLELKPDSAVLKDVMERLID